MILIKNLNKSFGSLKVFENLNIRVSKGETMAIVGPSGCGKSTLLNCITGLDTDFTGDIILNRVASPLYLLSNRISIVLQKYSNFEWQTVSENIGNAFINDKTNSAEQSETISKLIDRTGLTGFENSFINELSGGMQQRVAVARALAQENEILAFDEPFGALDISTREVLQNIFINEVRKQKRTAVFATHDISEAITLSDKVLCLSQKDKPIKLFETTNLDKSNKTSKEFLEMQNQIIKHLTYAK